MAAELKLHVPEQKILENAKTMLNIAKTRSKLAEYGMNEAYFSNFGTEIVNASGYKTDEQIMSELKEATKQKNKKLIEAGDWGDKVKTRLKLAFPNDTEIQKEFPANFTKAKRDETLMLEVITSINGLIDKYAVKLKEKGLPDDHKQVGIQLRTELDTLNTEQEKLKKLGPKYTQERIAAYTKIYNRVNEINQAGKEAYKDSPADLLEFRSPWPVSKKKDSNDTNTKTDTETKTETRTETTK